MLPSNPKKINHSADGFDFDEDAALMAGGGAYCLLCGLGQEFADLQDAGDIDCDLAVGCETCLARGADAHRRVEELVTAIEGSRERFPAMPFAAPQIHGALMLTFAGAVEAAAILLAEADPAWRVHPLALEEAAAATRPPGVASDAAVQLLGQVVARRIEGIAAAEGGS
jgi:hypothetical protein